MSSDSQLKRHLLNTGKISKTDLMKAEDYALTTGISLEDALVFLELMEYETVGESLGEIYGLPYHSLLKTPPPMKAKDLVPLDLAKKWLVFPVDYDEKNRVLTLALNDPGDLEKTLVLESNLFAPYQLAYTVASSHEIKKAIEMFYIGRKSEHEKTAELTVPEDFTILPEETERAPQDSSQKKKEHHTFNHVLLLEPELARARAFRTLLSLEGVKNITWASSVKEVLYHLKKGSFDTLLVNGNIFKHNGEWLKELKSSNVSLEILYYSAFSPLLFQQAYPYEEMANALISSLSFYTAWILRETPKRLSKIRLGARYGKLLGLRLGLKGASIDAITLAFWLSVPEIQRSFLESVELPYPIEEIINYKTFIKEETFKTEAIVYGIVKTYLDLSSRQPEIRSDPNLVRDIITKEFKTTKFEPILETFVNLLREDHLLQDVGKPPGKILILDPDITKTSGIFLRLSNDGYEVDNVSTIQEATTFLNETDYDVIISEIQLPDGDGLEFCRKLKAQPKYHDLLHIFLTSQTPQGLAAKSLEAGADDFLTKPVDLELLSLKISKSLSRKGIGTDQRGVSGSLKEMNLTDIVQILAAGDKEVLIVLEGAGKRGEIYIHGGAVTHAVAGDITGEEAFYRMMTWDDVNFQVIPCKDFPEPTIEISLMSLLMEGARLMDEANTNESI